MTKRIKDTGVTLEELYNSEKQLRVHFTHINFLSFTNLEYTLVMIGRDEEPDFMLSSFAGNFFIRSIKGRNK